MTSTESESGDIKAVPLVWVGIEELPVLAVNQLAAQIVGEDEFVITFGHVAPPLILGSPEERRAQLERVTYAQVKPVARVALTPARLREFVDVLTRHLQTYDDSMREENG